jgi:ATP-dependent DNA ligase
VPHIKEILDKVPNGTVFLGELFFYNKRGSRNVTTIMGCLKDKAIARQKKEKLSYYIFDCLAYNGENLMSCSLNDRIDVLYFHAPIKWETSDRGGVYRSIYIYNPENIQELIANVLNKGGEGIVLKLADAPYEPGKRTTRKSIKVKKEIEEEIDCFLTGNYKPATWHYTGKEIDDWEYWFNIKTNQRIRGKLYTAFLGGEPLEPITKGAYYGWAGAVEIGIYNNDKIVPIGWISNVTEEVKKGIIEDINKWKYKVAKVTAMMIESDTKALRHAKIMEWRDDKNWKDCDGHELK